MRIISNFHDFYDTAMGFGQDLELIYLRKLKKIQTSIEPCKNMPRYLTFRYSLNGSATTLKYRDRVVGFCGKIYGCIELEKINGFKEKSRKIVSAICYNIEEVDSFVEANYKKREIKCFNADSRWQCSLGVIRSDFVLFFNNCKEKEDSYAKFFLKNKAPIFICDPGQGTTLNASLKQLEFVRVLDPYTAFQELSMYWGGIAHEGKPIPEISDADMLEIKGFDKWSFKKLPGGKKRKKAKKSGNDAV